MEIHLKMTSATLCKPQYVKETVDGFELLLHKGSQIIG